MPNSGISLIIVSYHTGAVLFDCLAACFLMPEAREVILVDNGNPADVLERLRQLAIQEPRLRIISGHGNVGFSTAVNKGVAAASGNVVWILNPDATPLPDTLSRLIAEIPNCKAPWMIGCAIMNEDGTEQRGGRRELMTPWLAAVEGFRLDRIMPRLGRLNHHQNAPVYELVEMPATSGAAMFLTREAFLAIGGMDEGYFLHVEDMDFCLRFRRASGHIYYAGHIRLPHKGGTSDAPKYWVEWQKVKSFSRYFHKNFGATHPKPILWLLDIMIVSRFVLMTAINFVKNFLKRVRSNHASRTA